MFIISAFILGLLVAFNPCQLAINFSALTYLQNNSKNSEEFMRNGWLYALGRIITYSFLGIVLAILIKRGLNLNGLQLLLSKGEKTIPYLLIILGIYLLYGVVHHHNHHGAECHSCGKTIKKGGPSGALVLGLLLAFAFCPESAILYFGVMLPLSVANSFGLIAPIIFAIASIMPIIVLAYLFSKATEKAKKFEATFKHFQQLTNAILGITFIVAAIILIIL